MQGRKERSAGIIARLLWELTFSLLFWQMLGCGGGDGGGGGVDGGVFCGCVIAFRLVNFTLSFWRVPDSLAGGILAHPSP